MNAPALWTWPELCEALTLTPVEGPGVQRVIIDSRQARPGDLFVALAGDPGARFNPSQRSSVDGHDYVDHALAAGAVGALVNEGAVRSDAAYLTSADTYDGLWALGRAGRRRLTGPVIAVTGSSGKTTAKTFLTAALAGYGSPGSFNNHIGVPLTLVNAPPSAPLFVIEIGTNHPGEIAPLAEMAAPDLAIVLNVQSAHIENFPSKAALIEEKISIFNGLDKKGFAVCHESVAPEYAHTFGTSSDCEGRLVGLSNDLAHLELDGRAFQARVPGGGAHRAMTLTACALGLTRLGLPIDGLLALPDDVIPAGRGRMHRLGRHILIDEAYNANPGSMSATLDAFLERSDAALVILGEMLELGDESPAAHDRLVARLAETEVPALFVGEGFATARSQMPECWFDEAGEALLTQILTVLAERQGAILIKGSNRVFWQVGFVKTLVEALESI